MLNVCIKECFIALHRSCEETMYGVRSTVGTTNCLNINIIKSTRDPK